MRITNGIIARESITSYQDQMRALNDAQEQASTGARVSRPSDDPVAVAGIMQSSSGLRALDQYQSNVTTAQSRLNLEDSVLSQLSNTLERAKELGVAQGTDTSDAGTRKTANAEVTQLIESVKQLANTQLGNTYIFGGDYAGTAPYADMGTAPADLPGGEFQVQIGTGQFVDTNHSAQQVFGASGVMDSLQALSDSLAGNDAPGVRSSLNGLDDAYDQVQSLIGELGARMNQMDVASSNLSSLSVNLKTFRSGLQDADIAKSVTDLVSRQTSLQAAMLANSKILNLTMADYLK